MLTVRQKQILDFIESRLSKKGVAPSLYEIARHLKIRSVGTVHEHLAALQEKGYLKRRRGQARAISTTPQDDLIAIPLLGVIAAGEPIEAIENKETIAVPKSKVPKTADVYALRVMGESMADEQIHDGDVVLIKSQSSAENGQKVVALIDQDSVTLKTFYKEKGRIRLQPANQAVLPIYVSPSRLTIQGVVIDVIKTRGENAERIHAENVLHTVPRERRPKGGCELIYRGKTREDQIIEMTAPAELRLMRKHGSKTSNTLISGDNINTLKTLYVDPTVRGKIDLIYIAPPFGTGQNFVGFDESARYSDILVNTEFLEFLRQRLVFLRELLSERGSIYVHIDQKVGHYVKILLDEIFGDENFRSDITRIKCNPKNFDRKAYGNIKDVIYFYSRSKPSGSDMMVWNDHRTPLTPEDIEIQFPKIDKHGRRYATTPLHAKGETLNGPTGREWKGLMPPKGRHWRYAPAELTRLDREGLIEWSGTGNPRKIIYAKENRGRKIQDIWDFKDPGYEGSLYPTQKNDVLLELIIQNSTERNSVVLDCFAGAGTTLIAAQRLGRQWIGIDANKKAIELIEERMLNLSEKPSF